MVGLAAVLSAMILAPAIMINEATDPRGSPVLPLIIVLGSIVSAKPESI